MKYALAAACVLTILAFLSPSFAAPTPGEAAYAIEELSIEQRELLVDFAKLRPDDDARCRADGTLLCVLASKWGRDWPSKLNTAAMKLASFGGWRAASLPSFVRTDFLASAARPQLTKTAKAMADALAKRTGAPKSALYSKEFAALRARIDATHAGEPRPVFDSVIEDCERAADLKLPAGFAWIFGAAMETDAIDVVVGGPAVEVFAAQTFAIDGFPYFLAAVPKHALVTLRLKTKNPERAPRVTKDASGLLPEVRTFEVGVESSLLRVRTEPTHCFELDTRPANDPGLHVYVDGHQLESAVGIWHIPESPRTEAEQTHSVVVLRADGTVPTVLAKAEIPAERLRETRGCYRLAFDFTPVNEMQGVAIINAASSATCAARGIDGGDVRARGTDFLTRAGRAPREIRAWAEAVGNLSDLLGLMHSGSPVGATRGRLESRELLGSGAAEFARQGFHSVLSLELGCESATTGETRFTLRAHLLNLQTFLRPRDPVAGLDISGALTTESEAVQGDEQLDWAFVAVLSRLFGTSYVRFERAPVDRDFEGDVFERVRLFVPKSSEVAEEEAAAPSTYPTLLQARRLDQQNQYICAGSTGLSRTGVQSPADQWWRTSRAKILSTSQPLTLRPGVEVTNQVSWNPAKPALYLVRFELLGTNGRPLGPETVAYRCLNVRDNRSALWADLNYERNTLFTPSPEARNDDVGHGMLLAGISRTTASESPLRLGAAIGYANAVHSRRAPPAWELDTTRSTPPPTYDARGQVDLNWTRQSIVIGPVVEYTWYAPLCLLTSCSSFLRRFDLTVRWVPAFDIGHVDTSNIDVNLPRFMRRADGLDLDLSMFVHAGARLHIADDTVGYALMGIGWIGWDDFVLGGRDQHESQSSIAYDAYVMLGGAFGIQWGM